MSETHRARPRLLLIEDAVLISMAERRVLEEHGYDVVVAGRADEARAAIRRDAFDLVLLDVELGAGDPRGPELARELQGIRPVPIAFLSSHTDPSIIEETEAITPYGYIVKGANETVLLSSVRMALRLAQTMETLEATNTSLTRAMADAEAAHQEVALRERNYQLLLSNLPGFVYQYRLRPDGSDSFPFASEGIRRVYEMAPEEARTSVAEVWRRIHREDVDGVRDSVQVSAETMAEWRHDFRVILPTRGIRWIRGTARPEREDDGSILWYGYITDITDLKARELELAEFSEWYAALFASSAAILTVSDVETGRYVDVSESFCDLFGYDVDEVIGARSADLLQLDPEEREEVARELRETGRIVTRTVVATARDGTTIDLLLSATLVHVNGRPHIFTASIDVRPQRRAEREREEALATQRLLAAEMNHRVKNNLAMVAALVRMTDGELGGSGALDDLYARIEAITALHEELQLADGFDRVALGTFLRRVAGKVVATTTTPATVSLAVVADEELTVATRVAVTVGLIVNEIVTNAAKYGAPGGGPLAIDLAVRRVGDGAAIVVSDDGVPIPEGVALDRAATLGLRLVTMLAAQLDATVGMQRSPTPSFTIALPAAVLG